MGQGCDGIHEPVPFLPHLCSIKLVGKTISWVHQIIQLNFPCPTGLLFAGKRVLEHN